MQKYEGWVHYTATHGNKGATLRASDIQRIESTDPEQGQARSVLVTKDGERLLANEQRHTLLGRVAEAEGKEAKT